MPERAGGKWGWRLLVAGAGSIPAGTWGGIAAGATAALITALTALPGALESAAKGGPVTCLTWILAGIATLAAIIAAVSLAAWAWTGPLFAPWRAERERLRAEAATEAEQARALPVFEAAFAGWPEYRRAVAAIYIALNREESRMAGYVSGGPFWPELIEAASDARRAGEFLWRLLRRDAIEAVASLAELEEPIDYRRVQELMDRLTKCIKIFDEAIRTLASAAGVSEAELSRRIGV